MTEKRRVVDFVGGRQAAINIFLQEFWLAQNFNDSISNSLAVWPDLAKFRHFGKSLQVFGKFLTVYF